MHTRLFSTKNMYSIKSPFYCRAPHYCRKTELFYAVPLLMFMVTMKKNLGLTYMISVYNVTFYVVLCHPVMCL